MHEGNKSRHDRDYRYVMYANYCIIATQVRQESGEERVIVFEIHETFTPAQKTSRCFLITCPVMGPIRAG